MFQNVVSTTKYSEMLHTSHTSIHVPHYFHLFNKLNQLLGKSIWCEIAMWVNGFFNFTLVRYDGSFAFV